MIESVPYVVYESEQERHHKIVKRLVASLIITVVVSISALFATNLVWLDWFNQYDISAEETIYEQDGEGTNIIGDNNGVN